MEGPTEPSSAAATTRSWRREALDYVLDARERNRTADAVAAAGSMTFERLLRDWFAEKRYEVAPSTAERYRITIDTHVVPNIGHVDANLLTEADLKAY